MQRPMGIFIAGVILLISGLLGLLVCGVILLGGVSAESAPMAAVPYTRSILMVTGIVYAGISIFLGWVAVDLFRVRSWARYATIILAALGACFCAFLAVMMIVVRHLSLPNSSSNPSPDLPPGMLHGILDGMTILYFVLAAIALFWVFYFNRASVRAAFTAAVIRRHGQDFTGDITLSIPQQHAVVGIAQVIVWINAVLWLIGAVYMVVELWLGLPMFLLGWLATGTAAFLAEALFACLLVYSGLGLIFRWRGGWYLAIMLQLFSLASILLLLIPGYAARLFAASQAFTMRFAPNAPMAPLNPSILAAISGIGGFIVLIILAALVRCRRSYLL